MVLFLLLFGMASAYMTGFFCNTTVVHLLQRLLTHGFDLLLIVKTVRDLQRYLLLLHSAEFVIAISLLISRGTAVDHHFI